jgi:hypothetical protein
VLAGKQLNARSALNDMMRNNRERWVVYLARKPAESRSDLRIEQLAKRCD